MYYEIIKGSTAQARHTVYRTVCNNHHRKKYLKRTDRQSQNPEAGYKAYTQHSREYFLPQLKKINKTETGGCGCGLVVRNPRVSVETH